MGSPPHRELCLACLWGGRPGACSGLDGWRALYHGFMAVVWTPLSVLVGVVSVAAPPVVVDCDASLCGRLRKMVFPHLDPQCPAISIY